MAVKHVLGLAIFAAGCSVMSGWSDLQSGKPDAGAPVAVNPIDSGPAAVPPPDSPPPVVDSGARVPPPSGPTSVACAGNTRCTIPQGCCAAFPEPTCTTVDACNAKGWFTCTKPSDCASAQVCCLRENIAVCSDTCTSGDQLCDGEDMSACPVGQSCKPLLTDSMIVFHCGQN